MRSAKRRGFDSGDWDAMLKDDLLHRDFTVNAMAMDEEGNSIDLYGGGEDIAES